ncbi:MAG: MBL fold metallo-hydrolase [Actinomycetota bacterium]|nr:MBL fold metallo-hydrolase [Actinomycetota bacterium]
MHVEAIPVETVPLPTPFGVGPVNAFIIVADPITMVDAGVNTVDAENALKLGFAAKGLFLESVERILITHGHPDHYGLVPLICNGSGTAQAYMSEVEIERISDERLMWECGRRLQEAGFPEPLLRDLTRLERRVHRVHQVAQLKCKPISEGEVFEFRGFSLETISLPGHTDGHVGYLERDRRVLFAGDTLLPHASPNALLEPTLEPEGDWPSRRRHSLRQYLETLDVLQSLELTIVYPGHGPVITNPGETISYMREHHARRLDVVCEALTEDGRSAYEVCSELYPNFDSYDRFLAVCDVIAHLDVLVDQERARNEIRDDGVEYFSIV